MSSLLDCKFHKRRITVQSHMECTSEWTVLSIPLGNYLSWTSHSTFSSVHFLTCKLGIISAPPHLTRYFVGRRHFIMFSHWMSLHVLFVMLGIFSNIHSFRSCKEVKEILPNSFYHHFFFLFLRIIHAWLEESNYSLLKQNICLASWKPDALKY